MFVIFINCYLYLYGKFDIHSGKYKLPETTTTLKIGNFISSDEMDAAWVEQSFVAPVGFALIQLVTYDP